MNGKARVGRRLALLATAGCTFLGMALVPALTASASVRSAAHSDLPVPPGAIKHIIVIELENESYSSTFGASSPATYLNRHPGAQRASCSRATTPSAT